MPNSDSPTSVVRFRLRQFFEQGRVKVAISLPELTKSTNSFSHKNAPGCVPKLTNSSPKELFLQYNVTCDLETSDPNGHDVKIHFDLSKVTDDTKAKDLDVSIACTCPAALWWGSQWNLHQRDALEGEPRPLLTAPTERLDLRDGFILCKHEYVACQRVLPSVQHNITKVLREREVKRRQEEEKERKPPRALTERQKNLRKRQQQPTVDRDEEIRNKLLRGLEQREEPTPELIIRDVPATPEERERIPELPPEAVLKPIAPALVEEDNLEPIPEIEGLDDSVDEEEELPPPPPAPERPEPKPQTLPQMTKQDREYMRRLMREKQGK